jgi:hypothetical protein
VKDVGEGRNEGLGRQRAVAVWRLPECQSWKWDRHGRDRGRKKPWQERCRVVDRDQHAQSCRWLCIIFSHFCSLRIQLILARDRLFIHRRLIGFIWQRAQVMAKWQRGALKVSARGRGRGAQIHQIGSWATGLGLRMGPGVKKKRFCWSSDNSSSQVEFLHIFFSLCLSAAYNNLLSSYHGQSP